MANNTSQKNLNRQKKMQKAKRTKTILIVLIIIVCLALVGAFIYAILPDQNAEETPDHQNQKQQTEETPVTEMQTSPSETETDYVNMNVSFTDQYGVEHTGNIVVQLRPDCAPITVANFKKLVAEGYYDGTDFFRIVDGFMIQGGENDEMTADYIKGEFTGNGVNNPLKHEEGTISMSRRSIDYDVPAYDSASSGFFIVTETSFNNTYSLDGQYASFGSVISGMEYVHMIEKTELVYSNTYMAVVAPKYPAVVNSMTFVTVD